MKIIVKIISVKIISEEEQHAFTLSPLGVSRKCILYVVAVKDVKPQPSPTLLGWPSWGLLTLQTQGMHGVCMCWC
jgi:hypothetical protein